MLARCTAQRGRIRRGNEGVELVDCQTTPTSKYAVSSAEIFDRFTQRRVRLVVIPKLVSPSTRGGKARTVVGDALDVLNGTNCVAHPINECRREDMHLVNHGLGLGKRNLSDVGGCKFPSDRAPGERRERELASQKVLDHTELNPRLLPFLAEHRKDKSPLISLTDSLSVVRRHYQTVGLIADVREDKRVEKCDRRANRSDSIRARKAAHCSEQPCQKSSVSKEQQPSHSGIPFVLHSPSTTTTLRLLLMLSQREPRGELPP